MPAPTPSAEVRTRRIALAGNPNVGKTTVFNLLTGLRQKIANYPGVTVERKSGRLVRTEHVEIIDLPGTYSLNPKSIDERVAYDVLVGRMDGEAPPDMVVCVVDATNLERNLYLVTQIVDLGLPVVVALNMMDAAQEAGLEIDVHTLSKRLGLPVVPITARSNVGFDDLRAAMAEQPEPSTEAKWGLMSAVDDPVQRLMQQLDDEVPGLPERRRQFEALGALTSDPLLNPWKGRAPGFYQAVLDTRADLEERKVPYRMAEMTGRYGWLSPLAADVITRRKDPSEQTRSDKIDAVLTHRIAGPLIFAAILVLIFQAVFTWAIPAMDLIETTIVALGSGVRSIMPNGMIEDVMVEGVITGVGNVLVFLPQILLLFFFLGLMEDTGYMARTAFIMDRLMRRMGLSGASVVPLLSSYACAIPGIMAARTLANERDRLITIMVAPLMSCSARLPVYTLFIGAFIPVGAFFGFIGYQGLAMVSLYLLGTVMAFVAAWVLKRFVFKGSASMFVMELPPYRLPRMRQVLWRMVDRSKAFVVRAGRIIFGLSILLWFLASFPKANPDPAVENARAEVQAAYEARIDSIAAAEGLSAGELVARGPMDAVNRVEEQRQLQLDELAVENAGRQIRQSIIGRLGRAVEPIMRPLGFDWKISAGILSAFAAREVIVSTMATIYSVGEEGDGEPVLLRDALKADRYPNGEPVYTPLVAVSLMVFFVFALQCMSTLAIAHRETNTWKWPIVMWLYMFALAYVFSLLVYQGGQALGIG
ncbi:MAG TPA: ferrous iron transport protein B [Rhodothermales bacterium]|nr:ferrous iron transport protein B [Rhodothermales bacterium]